MGQEMLDQLILEKRAKISPETATHLKRVLGGIGIGAATMGGVGALAGRHSLQTKAQLAALRKKTPSNERRTPEFQDAVKKIKNKNTVKGAIGGAIVGGIYGGAIGQSYHQAALDAAARAKRQEEWNNAWKKYEDTYSKSKSSYGGNYSGYGSASNVGRAKEVFKKHVNEDFTNVTTKAEAQKIFRNAAKKYHPDLNPNGAETMKDLNNAWDTLKESSWFQKLAFLYEEKMRQDMEKQAFVGAILGKLAPMATKAFTAATASGLGQKAVQFAASHPTAMRSAAIGAGLGGATGAGAGYQKAKDEGKSGLMGGIKGALGGAATGGLAGGAIGMAAPKIKSMQPLKNVMNVASAMPGSSNQSEKTAGQEFHGSINGTIRGSAMGGMGKEALGLSGKPLKGYAGNAEKFLKHELDRVPLGGIKSDIHKAAATREEILKRMVEGGVAGGIGGGAYGMGQGLYRGFKKGRAKGEKGVSGAAKEGLKGLATGTATGILLGAGTNALKEIAKDKLPLKKTAMIKQKTDIIPENLIAEMQAPGSVRENIATGSTTAPQQPQATIAEQVNTAKKEPSMLEKIHTSSANDAKSAIREVSKGTRSVLPRGLVTGQRKMQRKTASDLSGEFGFESKQITLDKLASPSVSLLDAMEANGEYDELMKEAEGELTRVLGDMTIIDKSKVKKNGLQSPTPEEAKKETQPSAPPELADETEKYSS